MTEIRFYHLQSTPLERALPSLLERVLERDWRAVVMTGSAERVDALNGQLWTYNDRAFLPHGSGEDGYPEHQPVWLTHVDENPNSANVLFLTDGARSNNTGMFSLCCELFDGNDATAVTAARERWKEYQESGSKLTYWQQTPAGSWEKKAEKNT